MNQAEVQASKNTEAAKSSSKNLEETRIALRQAVEASNKSNRKESVWILNIIDIFAIFAQHQENKIDYFFVGQCIEAVVKTYAWRLDSLFEDAMKLCSALNRGLFSRLQ